MHLSAEDCLDIRWMNSATGDSGGQRVPLDPGALADCEAAFKKRRPYLFLPLQVRRRDGGSLDGLLTAQEGPGCGRQMDGEQHISGYYPVRGKCPASAGTDRACLPVFMIPCPAVLSVFPTSGTANAGDQQPDSHPAAGFDQCEVDLLTGMTVCWEQLPQAMTARARLCHAEHTAR